MDIRRKVEKLLKEVKEGKRSIKEVLRELCFLPYEQIKDKNGSIVARLDYHRSLRDGVGEVIFGQSKTNEQLKKIVSSLIEKDQRVIITKATKTAYKAIKKIFPKEIIKNKLKYYEKAKIIMINGVNNKLTKNKKVLIITGGTGDINIAEEAAVTLNILGINVERLYDVGVAGLHRLLHNKEKLYDKHVKVIIVVAGMEGALASVVSGLVGVPVIAVPTSIGYGANFKGLSALLTMLNACAPGIGVVNIDNGFGAAYLAYLILKTTKS